MGFLLSLLGFGKGLISKVGWQGIAIIAVIGLVFGLYIRGNRANGKLADRDHQIAQLQLQLSVAGAELDTIKALGRYPMPETTWLPGSVVYLRHDSAHVDTVKCPPIPSVVAHVAIDTIKYFGEGSNPFSVRVYGDFYTPEEFANKNRLLIVPSFLENWRGPVVTKPCHQYALGGGSIATLTSDKPSVIAFAYARSSRMSLMAGYDLNRKGFTIGLGYDLIRF